MGWPGALGCQSPMFVLVHRDCLSERAIVIARSVLVLSKYNFCSQSTYVQRRDLFTVFAYINTYITF
jgi:hypothetical protein